MKPLRRAYAVALLLIMTSGCASLGIGEGEYACKGFPGHPTCMSARDVYKATNYQDSLYPDFGGYENEPERAESEAVDTADFFDEDIDDDLESTERAPRTKAQGHAEQPRFIKASHQDNENRFAMNAPYIPRMKGAMPVRTNAMVMRIWIAPWEDKEGDLHAPGLVFKEIVGRRWNFGEAQYKAGRYMSPLTTGYRKPE